MEALLLLKLSDGGEEDIALDLSINRDKVEKILPTIMSGRGDI